MHTLMLRSQNNYVTPVLVLLMLAAVCQFSSRYLTRTNTNCAVGGFCVDDSIDSGIHGLCPTRQDRVVRYVRFVPLLLTYSNKVSCVKGSGPARVRLQISPLLLGFSGN